MSSKCCGEISPQKSASVTNVSAAHDTIWSECHLMRTALAHGEEPMNEGIAIVLQNGVSWLVTVVSSWVLVPVSAWPFPLGRSRFPSDPGTRSCRRKRHVSALADLPMELHRPPQKPIVP